MTYFITSGPGLEVIKLEFILRLKKSAMIGCLRTRVRKQPIIALYFESETGSTYHYQSKVGQVVTYTHSVTNF